METDLWTTLNTLMGKRWHASRVESHATSPGIPDVDYCVTKLDHRMLGAKGVEGHIELKHTHKLKRPKIRNSQVRWHHKRHESGGRSLILTHFDTEYEDLYMWHLGSQARRLATEDFPYWRGSALWVFEHEMDRDVVAAILRNEL